MRSASTIAMLFGSIGLLKIGGLALRGETLQAAEEPTRLDPAGWGSDHAGRPVPEHVTGDECLFCHRSDVGPGWSSNPHARVLRRARADSPELAHLRKDPALRAVAEEPDLFLLGSRRAVRFLKPNGYGRLSLFEVSWVPGGEGAKDPRGGFTPAPAGGRRWEEDTFAKSCAGCHTTGVDSERRFSDASLDCFVCHGDGKLDHSKDARRILLSKTRADPARVVISICAQCHVRTGRSRSTGLPYPNNFVPGDNLWRDLEADLSDGAIAALSPADRHVIENVRDVVLHGRDRITCLTCHDVHAATSSKHKRLRRRDICWHCHDRERIEEVRRPLDAHNSTCRY